MNYVPPPNKQAYYEQVWQWVRKIPSGRVATYGCISKSIPKPEGVSDEEYKLSASRWVGLAMAASTDDVPWHRVVNSQGKISHPDALKQQQLLEKERVYLANSKVNLVEYEWLGPEHRDLPAQGQLF